VFVLGHRPAPPWNTLLPMAPLPLLDPHNIARGLAEVGHALAKREVDHRALETLAVGTFTSLLNSQRLSMWLANERAH